MTRERSARYAIALLAALLVVGCADSAKSSAPAQGDAAELQLPADHPPLPQAPAAQPGAQATAGVVLETMDSGGYTYAKVDTKDAGEIWVAGPVTALAAGDSVTVSLAMPMANFTARSLDRTFEVLYFVQGYR